MGTSASPEIAALQKAILLSKGHRAKAISPGEKMLEGVRLFDQTRERIKAGIRGQHPDWSNGEVHREFLRILAAQRRRAEKNIYRLVGTVNEDGTTTPKCDQQEHA